MAQILHGNATPTEAAHRATAPSNEPAGAGEARDERVKLLAIDRASKFAFIEFHEKATRPAAGNFPRAFEAAFADLPVPCGRGLGPIALTPAAVSGRSRGVAAYRFSARCFGR